MRMAKFFLIVFTTLFGSITMLSAQLRNAKIAVGAAHSIVLNEKGEVFTFGAGVYGELGQGGENRMDIAQAITHPLLAGHRRRRELPRLRHPPGRLGRPGFDAL